MAQLAMGVVGAVIGSFVPGVGTYWGWTIGMAIGGIAFAPKIPGTEGPRLNDLKAQKSNYGIPIPIVYGAMRAAGNVIWATDVIETKTTEDVGGKGGGGQEQTTYSYSQSFAVGLCEGTIIGVRRIWANGKLIYNLSDTADNSTIIASNNSASGIRFYNGSETQTADSLIQSHVGAANTPAFRGLAYVVFESMQLADYGNRAPNLEFEVVSAGSSTGTITNTSSTALTQSRFSKEYNGHLYVLSDYSPFKISIYSLSNPQNPILIKTYDFPRTGVATSGANFDFYNNYLFLMCDGDISYTGSIVSVDISDPANPIYVSYVNTCYNQRAIKIKDGFAYISGFWVGLDNVIDIVDITNASNMIRSVLYSKYSASIYDFYIDENYLYTVGESRNFRIFNLSSKAILCDLDLGVSDCLSLVINGNYAYIPDSSSIRVYDISTITNPVYITSVAGIGTYLLSPVIEGDFLYCLESYNGRIIAFDIKNPELPVRITYSESASTLYSKNISVKNRNIYVSRGVDGDKIESYIFSYPVVSSADPSLSAITTDICSRVGLTAGDINVTALASDTVTGYMVQRGTARSWLEQLMQAYYFDAVESDGKIKFVKRGGASVVSIPEDDLAAHEYGSAPPDTLVTTRKQEMEMPVEVAVQYMDTNAAYAVGSQLSQRLTTDSDNKIGINLAISMSASKAKQISDVLMYDAWTSRTTFDAQQAWKYSYLEPTDIVTISKGGRTYTARIVSEDAVAGIYNRSLVLEDSSIYTQSASAPSMPTPTDTVSLTPLTKLLMLDIPLLRDQDDGYGFYAAACGYGDGWHGAQSFKSNDAGATWSSFGDPLISEASIGSASTALGNFVGGNIFDETNTVTVIMTRGELASDTEINILNGSNVALIGNEIVQFRTATLTATDTYQLSGLLRGRRGTEWAMTTHAIGDRFVLLSTTTTYLFYGPSSEYDVLRKYKGVSFGNYLVNATSQDFTNTAVALIPYAPVLLGGGRNASLDVVLNWTRRTRIAGGWNNYSDVPIGETTEAYEVEIYNATYTTLKRTITGLTTNTTTYTIAQQNTDFGSAQSVVYFKVYQISAIVGRGYESRGAA